MIETLMPQQITYCVATGLDPNLTERATSDFRELVRAISKLGTPKTALYTRPQSLDGYVDFHALDDGAIEMEIMEGRVCDFAVVDVCAAEQVLRVAATDTRDMTLREKLQDLSLRWLA